MFVIVGVRRIGVLFHTFYYHWAEKYRSLYRSLCYIGVRYILVHYTGVFVMSRFVIPGFSLYLGLRYINNNQTCAPSREVGRIAGASRHPRLETEPRFVISGSSLYRGSLYRGLRYIGVRYIGVFVLSNFVISGSSLYRGSLDRGLRNIRVFVLSWFVISELRYIGVRYTGVFVISGLVISGFH